MKTKKEVMIMKKILMFICVIGMICSLTHTLCAAVVEPIVPQWENVRQVDCDVYFSGNNGNVYVNIRGNAGTTSISGSLTLFRGNTEIESWNISGGRYVTVSDTFTGISGYTYKLVLDVDVTTNGVVENIEEEDSARCP